MSQCKGKFQSHFQDNVVKSLAPASRTLCVCPAAFPPRVWADILTLYQAAMLLDFLRNAGG